MRLGVEAEVGHGLDPVGEGGAHLFELVGVGGVAGEVVGFVGIAGEVVERFGGAGFEELALNGVELAGVEEVAPLFVGEGFVAVVVFQAVDVERLVAAHVLEVVFAVGADEVVFFVEAVGVAEGFVALVEFGELDAFAEEGFAVDLFGGLDAGEVECGGAEVGEADEPVDARAGFGVDQVFEVFGSNW